MSIVGRVSECPRSLSDGLLTLCGSKEDEGEEEECDQVHIWLLHQQQSINVEAENVEEHADNGLYGHDPRLSAA